MQNSTKKSNWAAAACCAMALASLMPSAWADAKQYGADAFAKGDYAGAVRAYETAVSTSGPSAGLYYNLAMAQVKDGQKPQAALNLHRALILDPRMIDARMALSDLDRTQGVPVVSAGWRGFLAEKVPLKALVIVGSVLAWLGAFLLLRAIFKTGAKAKPTVVSGALLVCGVAVLLAGALSDPRLGAQRAAVVFAKDGVTLLSAPADQSETVAKLPAGAGLSVLQKSGEWSYCQTPKGEKGWAPSKSVEPVIPTV